MLLAGLALAGLHAHAATVQYVYDELGRLIAVIDPATDTTEYLYDDVGNLLSVARRSSSQVSIVSFAPTRGTVGQAITIVGSGFSPDPAQNLVRFNGTTATVTSATVTSLVASVPSGATTGPISVTTPTGSATSTSSFIVRRPPQIDNFAPTIAKPGDTLTLTGVGFAEPDITVVVNKSTAVVISAADDSLSVRVPTATGGKISVTTPLGTATTSNDFFIVPAPHTIADVAATERIAIDGPGQVLALPAGKVGLVLFDGVADSSGIRLSLGDVTLSGGTFNVFKPDGTSLASSISFGTTGANVVLPPLPVTGTYGVLVVANAGASGNVTVAASTGAASSLSVGETIVISVSAGQTGSFTFSGAVGDQLGLEVKGVTLPSGSSFVVFRPGSPQPFFSVSVSPTSNFSFRMPALPTTGTYTVQVFPASNTAGSIQFTLWKDVNAGALLLDTPKTVTTSIRNQQARLTFSGTVGEQLGLEVKGVTLPIGSSFVVVRPDSPQALFSFPVSPTSDFSIRMPALPATGTYSIVIVPAADTTGSIQFMLWKDVNAGALLLDTPKTATTSIRNQQARLTFSATAGDILGLEVKGVTLPVGSSVVVMRPDNVQAIFSFSVSPTSDFSFRMPALLETGTYSIVI
ncbi:MAG: IPT/TIG domain-containing protein, partial [Burkholderiales bacterium]